MVSELLRQHWISFKDTSTEHDFLNLTGMLPTTKDVSTNMILKL